MKLSHDHYPILTKTQVRKIIETHIPEEVRPFVHGIEPKEEENEVE